MASPETLSCMNQSLRSAVQRHDYEGISVLLKQGCDLEAVDFDGETVLYLACKNRSHNVVELLLENRASVYTTVEDTGETALHVAAWTCREITVALLLRHHTDINAVTRNGETPLSLACQHGGSKGDPKVAELLIRSGADVHWVGTDQLYRGYTLVHFAVNRPLLDETLELLLDSKVDVNAVVSGGQTALHFAARKCDLYAAELLLENGALVNYPSQKKGFTALHFAVREEHWSMIDLLLKYEGNVTVNDKTGCTPLDYALARARLCRQSYLTELIKVFAKQLVKMKTQNLFLSKSTFKKLSKNNEVKKYVAMCEGEIEWMKNRVLGDSNIKMFDIFTTGGNRLADYVSNEDVEIVLELRNYEAKLSMYASVINEKFLQGKERRDLLRQSSDRLWSVINEFCELPYVCVERINRCLMNCDLALQIGQETSQHRTASVELEEVATTSVVGKLKRSGEIDLVSPSKYKRVEVIQIA